MGHFICRASLTIVIKMGRQGYSVRFLFLGNYGVGDGVSKFTLCVLIHFVCLNLLV